MIEPQESAASGDERAIIALRRERVRSFSKMISEFYENPIIQFFSGFDDGPPKNPVEFKRDPKIDRILGRKIEGRFP
jgi:hypothetical protein